MNKFLSKLTNKVTIILVGIVMSVLVLIIAHWLILMVPVISAGEQTKADLLVASYAQLIEQALDEKNQEKVDFLLNRLILLSDTEFEIPMVLYVEVKLIDGDEFVKSNSVTNSAVPFVAKSALFSPVTSEILGSMELQFNGEPYQRIVDGAQYRLAWGMLAVMLMLFVVQRVLAKMLKPLNDLADFLQKVEFAGGKHVPKPGHNVAVEIRQVWFAVEQLFSRLYQRETEVRQEHDAAQSALKQKLEAEAANKAKSQFLANMSHELRTPLNAIIGYSEMLKEESDIQGNNGLSSDLAKIQLAGKNLLSLINDVLDLSKVEAGKMQLYFEDVKIHQLVKEVVDTVTPMMDKNNNKFYVECPEGVGTIQADASKLRQSLLNLLSNAAKFTNSGEVWLKISRTNDDDKQSIHFIIRDTGIGLSEEQLGRLFTAFSQADSSTTREYGGTGLGLTISRRFCRLMGGDIAVKSQLDIGSEFSISLPVGMASSLEKARLDDLTIPLYDQRDMSKNNIVARDRRTAKSVVLVIDNDAMACDIAVRYLVKEGYQVLCESLGDDAFERIIEIMPNIILLDIMGPYISGWNLLERIKGDSRLVQIPVVMMTMVDEKKTAYTLGAVDYLLKPVERDDLVNAINRCVRKKGIDTILVVDDDADSRKLVRLILENEGLQVVEAENGYLGLMRVAERVPTLILLDLVMHGLSGEAFLDELEKNEEWRNISVLALIGADTSDEDIKRLSIRVDGVIQKGAYSIDRLLSEVRYVVGASKDFKDRDYCR